MRHNQDPYLVSVFRVEGIPGAVIERGILDCSEPVACEAFGAEVE